MTPLAHTSRKALRLALLAGIIAAAGSFAASAQTATAQTTAPSTSTNPIDPAAGKRGQNGLRIGQACKLDIATHCSTAEKGGGARIKCLADNKEKLAPECAAALDAQASNRQAKNATCRTEIQSLCGDTRGPDRRTCVEANASKLSDECATRAEKHADRRGARRAAAETPTPTAPAPSTATPATPKQ